MSKTTKKQKAGAGEPGGLPQNWHVSYVHQLGAGKRKFPENIHPASGLAPEMSETEWCSRIAEADRPDYRTILAAAGKEPESYSLHYQLQLADGSFVEVDDCCSVIQADGGWPTLVGSIALAPTPVLPAPSAAVVGRLLAAQLHQLNSLFGGIDTMLEWSLSKIESEQEVRQSLAKTRNYSKRALELIRLLQIFYAAMDPNADSRPKTLAAALNLAADMLRECSPSTLTVKHWAEPGLPKLPSALPQVLELVLRLALDLGDCLPGDHPAVLQLRAYREATGQGVVVELNIAIETEDAAPSTLSPDTYAATLQTLGAWWDGEISPRRIAICIPTETVGDGPQSRPARTGSLPRLSVSKTVLLVEDEPLVRGSMMTWLDVLGLEVLQASDGESALELFDAHGDSIDFVLQDFMLPGLDGQELLKRLKKRSPELPVIVYSGYASGHDPDWIKQQGASAFLSKPFRIEELAELLCELFDTDDTSP